MLSKIACLNRWKVANGCTCTLFNCLLKLSARTDAKSHLLHLYAFLKWLIKCVLKLSAPTDAKSHWLHLYTFSPDCVFICVQPSIGHQIHQVKVAPPPSSSFGRRAASSFLCTFCLFSLLSIFFNIFWPLLLFFYHFCLSSWDWCSPTWFDHLPSFLSFFIELSQGQYSPTYFDPPPSFLFFVWSSKLNFLRHISGPSLPFYVWWFEIFLLSYHFLSNYHKVNLLRHILTLPLNLLIFIV